MRKLISSLVEHLSIIFDSLENRLAAGVDILLALREEIVLLCILHLDGRVAL